MKVKSPFKADVGLCPALQGLLKSELVSVAVFDSELRYLASSPRWASVVKNRDKTSPGNRLSASMPVQHKIWMPHIDRALAGNPCSNPEDQWVDEDGHVHFFAWSISPWVADDGKTQGLTIVTEDLTREHETSVKLRELRNEAEEAFKKASIEAAANDEKNRFLATISHEIRNPLSGVIGIAQLLSVADLPKEEGDMVSILKGATTQLSGLLNDLLDFSKIQSGHLQFHCKPFDLDALISDMAKLKRFRCQQKGIMFSSQKNFWDGTIYNGDPVRVRQMIHNLLSNAFKFTNEGGLTLIASSRRRDDEHDEITVKVRDTGIGISEADQKRLFAPYTQVLSDDTYGLQGTGLGLSIVKNLVERMGGTVSLESELGVGSTFTLRFVLEKLHVDELPERKAKLGQAMPVMSILLVDDDDISRRITAKLIERLGHQVTQARSGNLALIALEERQFDVVVSDYFMQDMTGLKLLEKAKRLERITEVTKFVCLTGSAQTDFIRGLLAKGFDACYTKPLDVDGFAEKLVEYGKQIATKQETPH